MRRATTEVATKDDIAALESRIEERLREMVSELKRPPLAPRYITAEECAAHIGRTKIAVRRLVEKRQIPHLRVGRKVQFDREAIDRWLLRHARRGKQLVD